MAHLANFSFEFFYKIFTEDASLHLLYHGAKKSKMTKNSNQGVNLCSFSQFSFPFNFQMANALVLKFGTIPFRCLFSNTLLAIFDIFFRSKVIHRFVPKNGPKMTCGRVF